MLTAFTPDGRVVAAAFGNNAVSCRESSTGRELFRYTSESPLRALALSADGRTLVAACESGVVELRSLATSKRVALSISEVPTMNANLRFAFSPDGTRLATTEWAIPGGATPVTIWDVETGKRLGQYPGHRDRAADLLFAADGRSLVIAAGPTIRRWFLEGESEPPPLAGHKDEAWAVAFAPDGKLLASGSDDDDPETIKLWDPKTGRLIRGWNGGPGTTASLAFSPDGRILASAHLTKQDNVRLWDVATGKRLATLRGHTARARTLAFHPDGKLLASAGSDKTIRLWDVEERSCLRVLNGHDDTIQQLVFAPDGTQLASAASDGTVRLWDFAQGRMLRTLAGPEKFTSVGFSPDGRTLAGADEDGSITLWNAATGAQRGLLRDEVRVLRTGIFPRQPNPGFGGRNRPDPSVGRADGPRAAFAPGLFRACPFARLRPGWIITGIFQPRWRRRDLSDRSRFVSCSSLARMNHGSPNRVDRADATRESSGSSTEHRVEPHVLPHLGPLLFVVHQQLAIAEVLAFLLALGGDEHPPHRTLVSSPWPLQSLADPGGGLLAERLDDLVVERDEELGEARVALAGATAGELAVDPARFVPLGADDVQAAELGDALAELDVGSAAGHVGGDRHPALLAGLRDDLGLDLVVLGVQDLVLDPLRPRARR